MNHGPPSRLKMKTWPFPAEKHGNFLPVSLSVNPSTPTGPLIPPTRSSTAGNLLEHAQNPARAHISVLKWTLSSILSHPVLVVPHPLDAHSRVRVRSQQLRYQKISFRLNVIADTRHEMPRFFFFIEQRYFHNFSSRQLDEVSSHTHTSSRSFFPLQDWSCC